MPPRNAQVEASSTGCTRVDELVRASPLPPDDRILVPRFSPMKAHMRTLASLGR